MASDSMRSHVTPLAVVHLVIAGFEFLAGVILLLCASAVTGLLVGTSTGDTSEAGWIGVVLMVIALSFIGLSLPGLFAGFGLLKRRPWARILAMIVGGLQVFNVPVGTALAAYSFFVLLNEDVVAEFAEAPAIRDDPDES